MPHLSALRCNDSRFHHRDAEFTEEEYIFFSAERAEKKMIYALTIKIL
jgi:hypothetical protein